MLNFRDQTSQDQKTKVFGLDLYFDGLVSIKIDYYNKQR